MPVSLKNPEDISILRECGERLCAILRDVVRAVRPGISTADLDAIAEQGIREAGGSPIFKGYRVKGTRISFPASICTSINDEVVHGIPRKERMLQEADIVGIDIGMRWPDEQHAARSTQQRSYSGLVTDMAVTVGVGNISDEAARLIRVTEEALELGIRQVRPGATVGDIGHAVGKYLRSHGCGVIRDLAGHGVGFELHEEPLIPNYGAPRTGEKLREGMVLAIEPMATLGGAAIMLDKDEWTFRTKDGVLAAHFEKTIAVTRSGSEILTPFDTRL